MKKLVVLFILIVGLPYCVKAQDVNGVVKGSRDRKLFSVSHGLSKVLSDKSEGIDFYVNFGMELKNGWGYGLDFTSSSYTPSSILYDDSVGFFGGQLSGPNTDSKLYSFSPNMYKSFSLTSSNSLKLYVLAGPSVIYSRDLEYIITNTGGSVFSSQVYEVTQDNKEIIFGAFSKAAMRYAFNNVIGLEVSVYGNVNKTKSVYGLQFGVVLGRL